MLNRLSYALKSSAVLYEIYCAMLCCAMLCHAALCCAMSCLGMVCPALVSVLCYGCTMLYSAMLYKLAVFLVTQDMLLDGYTNMPHMHGQVLCKHKTRMQKGRD